MQKPQLRFPIVSVANQYSLHLVLYHMYVADTLYQGYFLIVQMFVVAFAIVVKSDKIKILAILTTTKHFSIRESSW